MFRRFATNLWTALVVGLATTLLFTGPAQSADEKTKQQFENWAKSINAQNPAIKIDARTNYAVTGYARSPYQRTLARPTGYRALMISPQMGGSSPSLDFPGVQGWEGTVTSPWWKGVIIGREPEPVGEGAVEPIGLPGFDYKLLEPVEGEPRKVRLMFWLAKDGEAYKNHVHNKATNDDKEPNKPSWEFEVTAAVVTPMTAAALDGRHGLFTMTAEEDVLGGLLTRRTPAIHPALEGHRLAYRTAILDLFAELDELSLAKALPRELKQLVVEQVLSDTELKKKLTREDWKKINEKVNQKNRLDSRTVFRLAEERSAPRKDKGLVLSAVVEKPWRLEEEGLKVTDVGADPSKAAFKFVHRIVYKDGKGDYEEIPVSDQVNKEVFGSLTATEKRLVREYNDAVIIHRIVYWVRQEKIISFDRDQNWSKMIEDLGDIYKANLDKSIDAAELAKAAAKWADEYTGKDREMPEKMKLK